jgi:arginine decarboxylase
MSKPWDPDQQYHVSRWGDGFFDINPQGELCLLPNQQKNDPSISIQKVIDEAITKKVQFPFVVRFHDVLRAQVRNLNLAFQNAIKEMDYQGEYRGVFPIKVNQMREVVEEIVDAGSEFSFGLEAGSKPEILAALAYNTTKGALTILNGYKDRDFMRLGLLAEKMDRNPIIVIENYAELKLLIDTSQEMGIRPTIGLRLKLSTQSQGKWASTSGDLSKFGLSIPEILKSIRVLNEAGMQDCIKLLHFHMGSQIADITVIKDAISEGARVYAKIVKMGIPLEYLDTGGGLAIDYDGSRSNNDSSRNYGIDEYAADLVLSIKQICDDEGVDHPTIISESGRAITAHHSCVITNVIDIKKKRDLDFDFPIQPNEHYLLSNMRSTLEELELDNCQEMLNDARQIKADSMQAFKLGILKLEEQAAIENLYWVIMDEIADLLKQKNFIPEDLQNLESTRAQQYLCNFSVFQSAADVWAIDQVLPIMPISRLNEEATESCNLCDISCDSDGKIKHFIGPNGMSDTIKLHKINPQEDYHIGIFLTGAYQDVMGIMHNLFGRLNEVHVFAHPNKESGFYIEEIIQGASSKTVLSTMQYNPPEMAKIIKNRLHNRITQGQVSSEMSHKLIDFYEQCLSKYTYLNNDN